MKNKWVKTSIAVLSMAFAAAALTGCESAADAARKPAVVEQMVQNSLDVCTRTLGDTKTDYSARLNEVLSDVRTKDLETLQNKNVTVCLDSRQEKQVAGFWDRNILGVFYNSAPEKPVLALYDNGNKGGFFTVKTRDYGDNVVERLADQYRDGDITPQVKFEYAGRYSCGKGCTTTKLKPAQDFDQDSIAKNPQLKTSPLKLQHGKAGW